MAVSGRVAAQVAERSVRDARERAEAEVEAFVSAGLEVLLRTGASRFTVADVLAYAGRSTRAFYRHFESKDELLLAIYDHEARASLGELRQEIRAAPTTRDAFVAWIDATLRLGHDAARARRTRVLAAEAKRLQAEHPAEFAAIAHAQLEPLVEVLARGRDDGTFAAADPERDAATVHAVVWALVEDALQGGGSTLDADCAHALRFCLPALGGSA
jgi:AcrR family transcriptional regulator